MKFVFVFLALLLSLTSLQAKSPASETKFKQSKVALVAALKDFLQSIQYEIPLQAKIDSASWWQGLKVIEEAYAAARFNCFYGGWPSHLKKFGDKHLCTNPKTSEMYQHSYQCEQNQLTCPSVLFGRDVCVAFVAQKDRLNAFAACQKKSAALNKKPELSESDAGDDNRQLTEYIQLVEDICEGRITDIKVSKNKCPSIQQKINDFKNEIGRAPSGVTAEIIPDSEATVVSSGENTSTGVTGSGVTSECVNCANSEGTPSIASAQVSTLNEQVNTSAEELDPYLKFSNDFKNSELCNPANNYPQDKAREHAVAGAEALIGKIDAYYDHDWAPAYWQEGYDRLVPMLSLTEEEKSELDGHFNRLLDPAFFGQNIADMNQRYRFREGFRNHAQRVKARLKQLVWKKTQDNPQLTGELAKLAYVNSKILVQDEETGAIDCPFVDRGVFEKALQGYKKLKGRLSKQHLTIVDYTKPSNQRRMYVLDMKNGKVLHNTWVAHGGGNGIGEVADDEGANPIVSNTNGSYLSSDGFILAKQPSNGAMFGPNVVLQGIDSNNGNVQSRAILLHGDSKTGGAYIPMNPRVDPEDLAESQERLQTLETANPFTADDYTARVMANTPRLSLRPTIGITNGCLGVPDSESLDRKTGTRMSQLDSLRRDVGGNTLIFSYSGPNMESRYFDN